MVNIKWNFIHSMESLRINPNLILVNGIRKVNALHKVNTYVYNLVWYTNVDVVKEVNGSKKGRGW